MQGVRRYLEHPRGVARARPAFASTPPAQQHAWRHPGEGRREQPRQRDVLGLGMQLPPPRKQPHWRDAPQVDSHTPIAQVRAALPGGWTTGHPDAARVNRRRSARTNAGVLQLPLWRADGASHSAHTNFFPEPVPRTQRPNRARRGARPRHAAVRAKARMRHLSWRGGSPLQEPEGDRVSDPIALLHTLQQGPGGRLAR